MVLPNNELLAKNNLKMQILKLHLVFPGWNSKKLAYVKPFAHSPVQVTNKSKFESIQWYFYMEL